MPTETEPYLHLIANKFRWITRIEAPDAPGFVFFGGELRAADFGLSGYDGDISLSGKGVSPNEAFAGCVGEGVEHLSRLEWGDEQLFRGTFRTADHRLDDKSAIDVARLAGYAPGSEPPELDWMQGSRVSDGARVLVPASLCIRRPHHRTAITIPSSVSTGCAAGPTLEVATLAALLEVIERDAVALWWMGGRRGRMIGLNTIAQTGAAELLTGLRIGNESRITWLLNLTSDIEIPCVAALSASVDGRGFACGTAARVELRDAIRAAILELCQSELGHHLVAAKRRVRGEQALNEVDWRKLDRAQKLDARACEVLHAAGFPEEVPPLKPKDTTEATRLIVERLQRIGVEPILVDLTRPALNLPAARVVAPGLQPFPSSLATDRLAKLIAHLGTRAAEPVGMPLF
jgi:ribosomal protein S12 methylthiotransferase accessory factor